MPEGEAIKIRPAKGRPLLTWVGKRPLRQVTAFPAQHIETFQPPAGLNPPAGLEPAGGSPRSDWPEKYPPGGLLFHGDNKEVLAHLLAYGFRGKVKLIYIDPPFDSGADYVRRVQLRGVSGAAKLDGESYTLGEQIQYTDIWANDNYLQFMYERLLLLKELLAEDGTIFLHSDWHKTHLLRCLLDEVFGTDNFRNEIITKRGRKKNLQKQFEGIDSLGVETDTILLYSKSPSKRLRILTTPERRSEEQWQSFWGGGFERRNMQYEILGFKPSYGQLLWSKERGLKAAENYKEFEQWNLQNPEKNLLDYWHETNEQLEFVRYVEGARCPEYWVPPKDEGILGNAWLDIQSYAYGYDYRTEKHEELLSRIIEFSSVPDDLILDCFIGSGTTAAVAQKLGRRWIGCDINKGAIQTTGSRLQTIISEQAEKLSQGQLVEDSEAEKNGTPAPAQLSFTVWRVNDYDLQIQHNEALELACEHVGVTRTKNDAFFDGTRGKALAKITPFNHPLTLLDLEEIKRELAARPEEERDITVICLGKETAVDGWLEEWNRLRRSEHVPNRIEVIELRTDPKYGKFFLHEPAKARVTVKRLKAKKGEEKILVTIENFVSPTIVERLKQQAGILTPEIDDWRAMVDSVMIDTAYNGKVFNIAVSDIPAKKTDLVKGEYELPAPKGKTTVAVKITDMLGEEILVLKSV